MLVLRSESPTGMCAKLRTMAASNNRDHAPQSLFAYASHQVQPFTRQYRQSFHAAISLIIACSRRVHILLFFAHITFVVNRAFQRNASGVVVTLVATKWLTAKLNSLHVKESEFYLRLRNPGCKPEVMSFFWAELVTRRETGMRVLTAAKLIGEKDTFFFKLFTVTNTIV